MACSLGAGSLALPKALFRNCGFGNGLFLIIFCGLAFLLCLKFLMKTSVKANISNYSELVEFCFSKVKNNHSYDLSLIYIENSKIN